MFPIVVFALRVNNAEWPSAEILFNEQLLNKMYGVFEVATRRNNDEFIAEPNNRPSK
jgi:hypothetical protein